MTKNWMVRRRKSGLNQGHQSIEGVKNNGRRGRRGGVKKEMKTGKKKRKKYSDKLAECVANSLLDLKLHVAYRHIFPE